MLALVTMLASLTENALFFPMGIAMLGMSIPIVAIVTDYLSKKERMRLIEKAIEHGASLDDLNLDDPQPKPCLPYRNGMVTLAIGLALIAVSQLASYMEPEFRTVLQVGGAITGAIGFALLANDWLNRKQANRPPTA